MTSISSETKNNPFRANLFQRIRSGKKFLWFLIFMQVLGLPLALLPTLCNCTDFISLGPLVDIFISIGLIDFTIATLAVISIIFNNFSYLFKPSETDLYFSLPITKRQRFVSGTLSGLFIYIVPLLISFAISMVGYSIIYFSVSEKSYFFEDIKSVFYLAISWYICSLITYLMLFGFMMMIAFCCGRAFEAVAYPLLFTLVVPLMIYLVIYSTFSSMNGIVLNETYYYPIFFTSPVGEYIYYFNHFDSILNPSVLSFVKVSLLSLLMTALYFFIAYKFYMRRNVESVGKPFAFRAMLYIIESAVIFIIINLQFLFTDSLVSDYTLGVMLLSVIAFVIIEILSNRKSFRFIRSLIRFLAVLSASFLLMFIMIKTDYLGIESYVPPDDKIESVELYVNNMAEKFTCEITDPETIKLVTDYHRDIIDNNRGEKLDYGYYSEMPDYDYNIRIEYTLTNSDTILRGYCIEENTSECAYKLFTSEAITSSMADMSEMQRDSAMSFQLHDCDNNEYALNISYYLSYEKFKNLRDVYIEEYRSMTYEDFQRRSNIKFELYVNWTNFSPEEEVNYCFIYVPECFEKTYTILYDYALRAELAQSYDISH